jgi:hypothetical protein
MVANGQNYVIELTEANAYHSFLSQPENRAKRGPCPSALFRFAARATVYRLKYIGNSNRLATLSLIAVFEIAG